MNHMLQRKSLDWQNKERIALYMAAGLSFLGALLHLSVIPEHFEEWWGYGAFFLIISLSQGLYTVAVLRWSWRPLLTIGIAGNYAIFVLHFITRTVGVPFLGPHAGEVEGIGAIDLASKWVELSLILVLAFLLRFRYQTPPKILQAG